MSKRPKLIVVLGPTASGKSDLAVRLAKKYDGEVISADSRQVYRGLDIGSGKVPRDRIRPSISHLAPRTYSYRGVPHHLLDVISPKSVFTVARYQKLARKALRDILRRGKLPIIVGGTGLYINSVLYDSTIPEVKPDTKLRARLEKKSTEELFAELAKKDPARAQTIDAKNKRRLIRAIEIVAATGKPVPAQAGKTHAQFLTDLGIEPQNILEIGINPPADVLRERIHKRLLSRVKQGMIREVERLHKNGVSWKRLDDLGLEYRYVSRYLRTLSRLSSRAESRDLMRQMLAKLETEIWHYARRQMTWFKRDPRIKWVSDPAKIKRL